MLPVSDFLTILAYHLHIYSLIYDSFHRLTRTGTCINLKTKLLKNYYKAEMWGLFQTKSQFSEFNITETDFCLMHIYSVIIINSFKNKANPIYDIRRVIGVLN